MGGLEVSREALHDPGGLYAYPNDLSHETDDVPGVILAVRIGVAFDLILVDDPFQRRAGPEAVFEGIGGNSGERQRLVYSQ